MPMDLSADLAAARTEANEFLFETGDVYRRTQTRDAAGGVVEAYPGAPTIPDVPANVKDVETSEIVIGDRLTTHVTARLEVPFGTDIRETDRFVASGNVWEVVTDRTGPLDAYSVFDLERAE